MSAAASRCTAVALLLLLTACGAGEHARRRSQSAVQVLEAPLSEVWPHVRAFAQAEGLRIREDPESHVLTTDWVEHFGGSKHAMVWERWAFIGRDGGPARSRVWVLHATRSLNPALRHPGEDLVWGLNHPSARGNGGARNTATYVTDNLQAPGRETAPEGNGQTGKAQGKFHLNAAEDPNAVYLEGENGVAGETQDGGRAFDVEEKLLAFLAPRLEAARAERGALAGAASSTPAAALSDAELQEAQARVLHADAVRARCGEPVAGTEDLLRPAAVLLLGEAAHGTVEAPRFLERLACGAVASGTPVTVGLELPVAAQPRLAAYLDSDGGAEARAALLAHPFWKAPYPDGRSSHAMFALVEALRALRATGASVGVVAYDFPQLQGDARQQAMARRLLQVVEAAPGHALVVLGGNAHARRARGGPWGKDFEPMALRLARALPDVVSLDMSFGPGSAWTCSAPHGAPEGMVCGPVPMRAAAGAGLGTRPYVLRFADGPRNGFDGYFFVGPVRASPPATGVAGSGGGAANAAR